jgi:putative ABC transport system permease protein
VVVIGVLLGSVVAAAALAGVAAGTTNTYGVMVLAIPWRLLGLIFGGSLIVVGGTAAGTSWSATRGQPDLAARRARVIRHSLMEQPITC